MNSFPLERIPPSSYFTKPVYLDPQFVIAAPETPFTAEMAGIIAEWDFTEIFSEGEPGDRYMPLADDSDIMHKAEQFYTGFHQYADSLFVQIASGSETDFNSVAENVKSLCEFVREDHRSLMRVLQHIDPAKNEDYLISHTVRSAILAVIIGAYLKLPSHRLIELGVAAVLHEIGMIKLPPQCYMSDQALTEKEKKLLYTHTIEGYKLLKSLNFPLAVSIAAIEHHERENGTGYPQKLTGDKLSLYAKIIAVACSYEAISAKRPHREAKDGYTGMLELLKNEGKQYNETVIRALVYSLSIYPIGLYVLLSNGKKGQVVDINPEDPRFPVVQAIGMTAPGGKNQRIQTSAEGLSIIRPLAREEV